MTKEDAKELCRELYPLAKEIAKICKLHGAKNGASASVNEDDGYIDISTRNDVYEAVRAYKDSPVMFRTHDFEKFTSTEEPLFKEGESGCEESGICQEDTKSS